MQVLAGYKIGGTWGMVGSTYTMNIWGLVATENAEGLGALTDQLVGQAEAAGASDISVTGSLVTRQGLLNQSYVESYGWTFQQIDANTINLTMKIN